MDRTTRIRVLGTMAFFLATAISPAWANGTNKPPVAEAGLPRYAAKDPVRLDGSGSYDPDHSGPLTYAWTQVSGPPLVITETNTATPTISGFVQTEEIQECEFSLTVSDDQDADPPVEAMVLHYMVRDWYRDSLILDQTNTFNDGIVAGAYWSVIGPGKNLQLALTPGLQTYNFDWCGDATPTIRNCTVKANSMVAIEFGYGHPATLVNCTLVGEVAEGSDPLLIAHWRLDEEEGTIAHNATGDTWYNATLDGSPLWQPDGGRIGGALAFDGKDDRISTPFVLNPAEGPFSVFAWVKGGGPGRVVISQTGKADWLMAAAPGGQLRTGLSPTGVPALMADVVITDGQWHRIGLVWDGTHRSLYADDNLVAQDISTGLLGSGVGLYVGVGNKRAAASYWSGLIDDVRIYNRAVKP